MTSFRFILAFAPGTSSQKLKWLIEGNILSGIISLVIIKMGYVTFACYLSGLMFGLSMSSIYPLVFSFPIESGLNLEEHQTTNIVMAGVIAEGVLTMFVGILMDWFSVNMLFYALSLVACVMWIVRYYCVTLIDNQKIRIKNDELSENLLEMKKIKN
jgi:xanthine/uracil permease